VQFSTNSITDSLWDFQIEALAIYALKKFFQYFFRRKLILVTDHPPFVAFIGQAETDSGCCGKTVYLDGHCSFNNSTIIPSSKASHLASPVLMSFVECQ